MSIHSCSWLGPGMDDKGRSPAPEGADIQLSAVSQSLWEFLSEECEKNLKIRARDINVVLQPGIV